MTSLNIFLVVLIATIYVANGDQDDMNIRSFNRIQIAAALKEIGSDANTLPEFTSAAINYMKYEVIKDADYAVAVHGQHWNRVEELYGVMSYIPVRVKNNLFGVWVFRCGSFDILGGSDKRDSWDFNSKCFKKVNGKATFYSKYCGKVEYKMSPNATECVNVKVFKD